MALKESLEGEGGKVLIEGWEPREGDTEGEEGH